MNEERKSVKLEEVSLEEVTGGNNTEDIEEPEKIPVPDGGLPEGKVIT